MEADNEKLAKEAIRVAFKMRANGDVFENRVYEPFKIFDPHGPYRLMTLREHYQFRYGLLRQLRAEWAEG